VPRLTKQRVLDKNYHEQLLSDLPREGVTVSLLGEANLSMSGTIPSNQRVPRSAYRFQDERGTLGQLADELQRRKRHSRPVSTLGPSHITSG
jgi:hypothetical protein